MDHPTLGNWQRTGDPRIGQFVRQIEAQQHGPDARPELGDLAVALQEDSNVDRILMDRPETAQMLDDSVVDLTDPAGMAALADRSR